jgi:hypothetical protein
VDLLFRFDFPGFTGWAQSLRLVFNFRKQKNAHAQAYPETMGAICDNRLLGSARRRLGRGTD